MWTLLPPPTPTAAPWILVSFQAVLVLFQQIPFFSLSIAYPENLLGNLYVEKENVWCEVESRWLGTMGKTKEEVQRAENVITTLIVKLALIRSKYLVCNEWLIKLSAVWWVEGGGGDFSS